MEAGTGSSLLCRSNPNLKNFQPGDISPRLGEVHFTPGDFFPPSTPPSQVYCIVYELAPSDKDGCFSFVGGFPFTILSVACLIPVEVIK
jgi:hypothetical protein